MQECAAFLRKCLVGDIADHEVAEREPLVVTTGCDQFLADEGGQERLDGAEVGGKELPDGVL